MRKAEVLVNTTIQIRALVVDELKISMGFNSPYTHSGEPRSSKEPRVSSLGRKPVLYA